MNKSDDGFLERMTGDTIIMYNAEDFEKLVEEVREIRKILNLQSEEIKLINSIHDIELKNRDIVIDKLKTRINFLEKDISVSKIQMEHYAINVDNNEQYSRRHSLRLAGIEKEKKDETPDDVMGKVYEEMDYLDAPIKEVEIDRAHRTGKKYKDESGKWQQSVLLKFNSWKARNRFYRLRKYSNYYMSADLTIRNENVLNYAREQIKQVGSLANEYVKFVYADANCTLMAFTTTGRYQKFNTEAEFNAISLNVDNTSHISESIYDMIGEQLNSLHPGE